MAISTPGTLSGQPLAGYGNDYVGERGGTLCSDSTWGPDRVYSIQVPGTRRLRATVQPAAGADATLLLVGGPASACDARPRTCLGSADDLGPGGAEVVTTLNSATDAREVFIIVDSYDLDPFTFSLVTAIETLPAGEVCTTAKPIATPGTLPTETLVGFADDYGSGTECTGTAGPDSVYSIVVPAGKKLLVTVDPATAWDPSVNLMLGPASNCETPPRVCLTGADDGADGDEQLGRTWQESPARPEPMAERALRDVVRHESWAKQWGAWAALPLTGSSCS